MSETVVDNRAWVDAEPGLSEIYPVRRDDPCQLLRALDGPVKGVEVIVLDDGTGDPELTAKVAVTAQEKDLPVAMASAPDPGPSPATSTGTSEAALLPFPSWPWLLDGEKSPPQHLTPPLVVKAQVCP
mgnify:CR=1 FL=1